MAQTATVQQHARLHEKAVQDIARGVVIPFPKRGRRRPERRSTDVQRTVVDRKAWRTAKRLLGPSQRLLIVSEHEVWVVNRTDG